MSTASPDKLPPAPVVAATDFFVTETGRRASIEWTLIAGVNDGYDQAATTVAKRKRKRGKPGGARHRKKKKASNKKQKTTN